jgi:hypothetical protein
MERKMLTAIIVGILCFSVFPMVAQIGKVYAAPSVSISPTSGTIDVGQSLVFNATASGGAPPYYPYYWGAGTSLLAALTRAAKNPTNSTTWTFTPSAKGTYYVLVVVNDSAGGQNSAYAYPVTVNSAVSISISPTSVNMSVGYQQPFYANATGGTPPYYPYYWGNGTSLLQATGRATKNPTNSSTWTFTPSTPGTYYIVTAVMDSVNETAATYAMAYVS